MVLSLSFCNDGGRWLRSVLVAGIICGQLTLADTECISLFVVCLCTLLPGLAAGQQQGSKHIRSDAAHPCSFLCQATAGTLHLVNLRQSHPAWTAWWSVDYVLSLLYTANVDVCWLCMKCLWEAVWVDGEESALYSTWETWHKEGKVCKPLSQTYCVSPISTLLMSVLSGPDMHTRKEPKWTV
jgi:hypothetical protein